MIFGYATTAALIIATIGLILSVIASKKDLLHLLRESLSVYSMVAAAMIVLFFVLFSILYVHPVEQLYFDENIYQGIALNILMHGNAEWCQYGTNYARECFASQIYHDPVGISFVLAIAFGLFGIGIQTAYNLQLLIGALTVLLFFLFSSVLLKRKDAAVIATLVLALMPELFIWSRTQAIPDLFLTAFSTLTFFLFLIFVKRQNVRTFSAFLFSLILTLYMRTEAILLIGIFAVLYLTFGEQGIRTTIRDRFRTALHNIDHNTGVLLLILAAVLLSLPQVYFLFTQVANPQFGQEYNNQQLFSLGNLEGNLPINVQYFLGVYNSNSYYPTVFPEIATLLAIVGVAYLVVKEGMGHRFGMLLLLLLWFGVYQLFFGLFYAGSALFGVDVRFMLQAIPAISALAALGVIAITDLIFKIGSIAHRGLRRIIKARRKSAGTRSWQEHALRFALYAILTIALIVLPFIELIPIITMKPQDMPQQSVIFSAMTAFYNNYNSVPTNCMVFTFTPDIWFEVNRSAAQISYMTNKDPQFENNTRDYSCFVFDSGYWCGVPPYRNTTCRYAMANYVLSPLATQNFTFINRTFGYYRILNYTP